MAKGTKIASVTTSCSTLSCASDTPPAKPMRLAGTCSRYSKSAIAQLTSAATYQGLACRCLRCPYQANVMNRFDAASIVAVTASVCHAPIDFPRAATRRKTMNSSSSSKLTLPAGVPLSSHIAPRNLPAFDMVPHLSTSLTGPLQELERVVLDQRPEI